MIINIIKKHITKLLDTKEHVIIAIDGNCTAGKTTLAQQLSKEFDCNVFHMDDFFLRPEQKTPDRLAEPGGNVDYERFLDEVLLPLKSRSSFSFHPYHCGKQAVGAPIHVTPKQLNIIEGSYSHHPYFGDSYDMKIFIHIDPTLQLQRIQERPAHLHRSFLEAWIPMEQKYFDTFQIPEKSDLLLSIPSR